MGATRVVGVDIDPAAPQVTLGNAKANGVEEFVEASTTSLPDLTDRYSVIVANMLASALIESAPQFVEKLRPGGRLIISGILESQIDSVVNALQPLTMLTTRSGDAEEGLWVCLTLG